MAAKIYESVKLSLGQAAILADLSKLAFSEILIDFNVSLINYHYSEIIRDAAQFYCYYCGHKLLNPIEQNK